MSDGITLLPPPDSGWVWQITEVRVAGETFWAMTQQRAPEPPAWWGPLTTDPEYGQGLSALLMVFMGAKKAWSFWQRRKG